jgi:hypothetical protein
MAIERIATVELVPVDATGSVVDKDTATIRTMMGVTTEARVREDPAFTSPPTWPTVYDYLTAEGAAGRTLLHMDQTYIVTGA